MQLTIIKNNRLNIFNLPENISGSHWITDFENGKKINLINVEADGSSWKLISNQEAYIIDDKDILIPSVNLSDYSIYRLKSNYKNEKYYLYCSPIYDESYKELSIDNQKPIRVGSDASCEIAYNLNIIPKRAYSIEKNGDYYYLMMQDSSASVYVNEKRVLTTKRLEYGDIIFTFGLKVILMKRDGKDYLLVNNPSGLLNFSATFATVTKTKSEFIDDNSELSENIMLKDENYFYRAPHFYNTLEKFSLTLDAPPSKKEEDKNPAVLTIGPMITMSMVSVVMLLSSLTSGSGSITTMVMAGAMLASSLLWPLLTRTYQKFADARYERKRVGLYKKYLNKKEKEIELEKEKQRTSLIENNLSVADSQNVIRGHNVKMWQRRVTDEDFLTLPVGIGDMPMQIEVKYPEEHFSLEDDELLDMVHALGEKERILKDVPIIYPFFKNNATGIVGDAITNKDFIDRIILQIMANYSYDEVKIATFTSTDNETDWDYLKVLPHSWSNDKSIRYFGSSSDDYREIVYSLESIYNERKNINKEIRFMPHYVIVTDAIKSIDNYDFIKDVMVNGSKYGFTIIMMTDKLSALPNECKNFINVNRTECGILSNVANMNAQRFKIDFTPIEEIYNCAKELSNIPVNIKSEVESSLPDSYQFLEMYQVGKVEQLNSGERWKKNNPILSLQAPIGIGKSGEVITLDLHEKYHGPHGLIAGTTGSGKSEFIISYILSLAVNYHPNEVQIILIDYKGGSLAGAFVNNQYRLPHLAGTITNLDGNELNRSLASIESEIKRRQALFNEARKITNESTIDIYKYQKLYRENRLQGMEPIAHLFIISDEFAELKEQQPEFMDKLISAARVGRSLGVHLILATQKPGGVVDPQIWSNSRFHVCLKVQDTSDSQEILKKPDAAYLKRTGRFYLQVGYDEVFTLGQAAWAGGQYYPNTTFMKEADTSVNVINNIGFITTTREPKVVKKLDSQGEELPNIVKYLSDLANSEGIKVKKLWLDKIPESIYVDNLNSKYNYTSKPYYLDPIIGEYDDPDSQNQFELTLPLSKHGNAIVYGSAGSGKEMFLKSLIYSTIINHNASEVNFYIADLGAETLRMFEGFPHVGDIVYASDDEKINNMFKLITGELDARKKLFSEYGGNYQTYINESGKKVPNIVVVINNFEVFNENYEDLVEVLNQLSRDAYKYGIYFIITANSDSSVRLKTKQNFNLVYSLQQNSESDYYDILGNYRGKVPAKYKGRGLFKKDGIHEFQTAKICNGDEKEFIKELKAKLVDKTSGAKKVPILPNVVNYSSISSELSDKTNIPIGIDKNELTVAKFNLKKNAISLISSFDLGNTDTFVSALIDEMMYLNEYETIFINTTDSLFNNANLKDRQITKKFDSIFEKLYNYVINIYDMYEKSSFDESLINKQRKYVVFVYGVGDFINKLNEDNKKKLAELMKKDNDINIISFIFIDNPDIIKSYAYDEWFKNGADTSRGIWIGSGIGEQSLLKVSRVERQDREDISNEYGYIVVTSKITRIKLLNDFKV